MRPDLRRGLSTSKCLHSVNEIDSLGALIPKLFSYLAIHVLEILSLAQVVDLVVSRDLAIPGDQLLILRVTEHAWFFVRVEVDVSTNLKHVVNLVDRVVIRSLLLAWIFLRLLFENDVYIHELSLNLRPQD